MVAVPEFSESRSDERRASAPAGGLQSVLSALDVLELFKDESDLGVTEVARSIGVAKSTAHRLLTTLAARGIVEQSADTGRYRLGLQLFEYGQITLERNTLHKLAVPLLHELRHATGATIHLAVPDGSEVVYLERLISGSAFRNMTTVGRRLPSHCTGSGKVIAAFAPRHAMARSAAGFSTGMTSHSIQSARDFDLALVEVRGQGFALNVDEALEGMASVAAPVLGADGSAKAAISIVGPTTRILHDVGRPVQMVQRAAQRLAHDACA